ncbi:MAG: hypothetical protein MZU95_07630 [Desulfomicrobium escambiense]|nr:hypothetical protein [Desulfomicrobium escambiense]
MSLETASGIWENFGRSTGAGAEGPGRVRQREPHRASPCRARPRSGCVGDMTASLLEYAGWEVEREYYINDAGLQMNLLGQSTQARYFEILGQAGRAPFPENGYKGDYIYDLAREVLKETEKVSRHAARRAFPSSRPMRPGSSMASGKTIDFRGQF